MAIDGLTDRQFRKPTSTGPQTHENRKGVTEKSVALFFRSVIVATHSAATPKGLAYKNSSCKTFTFRSHSEYGPALVGTFSRAPADRYVLRSSPRAVPGRSIVALLQRKLHNTVTKL